MLNIYTSQRVLETSLTFLNIFLSLFSGPVPEAVVMLNRKEVGNPADYFDKNFADYKEGFESRGKYSLNQIIFVLRWVI